MVLSLVTTASDGFFLNLSWVLLLLSEPFARSKEGVNPRLLRVDPCYCVVRNSHSEQEKYGGAVVDFTEETKMSLTSSSGQCPWLAHVYHVMCQ